VAGQKQEPDNKVIFVLVAESRARFRRMEKASSDRVTDFAACSFESHLDA
jgi:hypothetical protein